MNRPTPAYMPGAPPRPNVAGCVTSTPIASCTVQLLGGATFGNVVLTHDQLRHLGDLYGTVPELPNEKPPPPVAPERAAFDKEWKFDVAVADHERALKLHEKWEDPQRFMQAGAERNVIRAANSDGLRIVAWLAQYLKSGDDPMKLVVQLVTNAGWDVDPEDYEWSQKEDDDENT